MRVCYFKYNHIPILRFNLLIDSGLEITKEYINKLFNPFIQKEHWYNRKIPTLRAGIIICEKYVDTNKAEISV